MEEIQTGRLKLRPLTQYEMVKQIEREEDAHMKGAYTEMLGGIRAHPDQWLWYTDWDISQKDGVTIGGIGYKGPPKRNRVEVGYEIQTPFQRRGYATEAVLAMAEWAFEKAKELRFIEAEIEPGNAASLRVLQKAGFLPAGMGEEGPRLALKRTNLIIPA